MPEIFTSVSEVKQIIVKHINKKYGTSISTEDVEILYASTVGYDPVREFDGFSIKLEEICHN